MSKHTDKTKAFLLYLAAVEAKRDVLAAEIRALADSLPDGCDNARIHIETAAKDAERVPFDRVRYVVTEVARPKGPMVTICQQDCRTDPDGREVDAETLGRSEGEAELVRLAASMADKARGAGAGDVIAAKDVEIAGLTAELAEARAAVARELAVEREGVASDMRHLESQHKAAIEQARADGAREEREAILARIRRERVRAFGAKRPNRTRLSALDEFEQITRGEGRQR